MTDALDRAWYKQMVYIVRAYATWYLIDEALTHLALREGDAAAQTRYHTFVQDSWSALRVFEPPDCYHVLHQDLLESYGSINTWLNGTSRRSLADIWEVFNSLGMDIKQEMTSLGLRYDATP